MPQRDDLPVKSYLFKDPVTTDLRPPGEVDTLFACLANHRRRLLIECISERSGPIVVEELVQHILEREAGATPLTQSNDELARITISLFHNHLPKMIDAGVIEIDHQTNTVQEADRIEIAKSLLETV